MKFSIISISYQTHDLVNRVRQSYAFLKYPRDDFEIIIVDDGSRPPLDNGFGDRDLNIKRVYLERSYESGRARARNEAVKLAEGEFLVFVDGDCLVGVPLLQKYQDQIESKKADVILGSYRHLILSETPNPVKLDYLLGLELIDEFNRHDCRFRLEKISRKRISEFELPWLLFISRNFCISKSLFGQVGGFNSDFKGWGSEDSEFAYRLCKQGIQFELIQNRVYHIAPAIEHEVNPEKYFQWVRNIGLFYEIHKDPKILLLMQQESLIYDAFVLGKKWDVNFQINSFQQMNARAKSIDIGQ